MAELPSHILKALRKNRTSLGDHPAFPPEEEEKFAVGVVSSMFSSLAEKAKGKDFDTLRAELGRTVSECRKIERRNRQALEQLCNRIITEMFDIPSDSVVIEASIVDSVDTSGERMLPEKTEGFSFDDIDDMNRLSDEIYKRRMLNALVTGASLLSMDVIGRYVREIFEIDPELPSLYKRLIDYNNVLIYMAKDTMEDKGNTDGGKVDVTVSSSRDCPKIKAEGILFPIMLEETVKGILELAISHGLPDKIDKAKYVIGKSDFKLAEMWDMRLGMALWGLISDEVAECGYDMDEIGANFFLMELAEMDTDEFNSTLKEIFARTRKGKRRIDEIVNAITYGKDSDDFDDFMAMKNSTAVQINDDDYFTSEELIADCDLHDTSLFESKKKNLNETEYNYHFTGDGGEHDMKPYGSDKKYVMPGRETGHFGSGTYFSTYPKEGLDAKYAGNTNPNFIRIDDKVYRVDFSIYRNLYRVRSKKQGDMLYTLCYNLNRMYSRIAGFGHFRQESSNYSNSDLYQVIKANSDALGLRCPSYYQLIRMAQSHEGDQSFSTLFMEYNGYNGVNVSGIEYYDNTTHGSVIYDLSKTDTEMEEVRPKSLYTGSGYQPYNDTVARNIGDDAMSALRGDDYGWYDSLDTMPEGKAMRLLRNYTMSGNVLQPYIIGRMGGTMKKRYLRMLYSEIMKGNSSSRSIIGMISDYSISSRLVEFILETDSLYWANVQLNRKSMLVKILDEYSYSLEWDAGKDEENSKKKAFLERVLSVMDRGLTDYERRYIDEDYYED